MSKRSMVKTNPDYMKDIDNKNPENKQSQSIQSNAYNETALYDDAIKHRK